MPTQHPISKWWPIGLGITSLLLYAIGGGLVGNSAYTDGYYIYLDTGKYYGGIALCALGSFAFIAFVVMLVLYFVRRNRITHQAETSHGDVSYAGTQSSQQNVVAKPEAVVMTNQINPQKGSKFCGNCGSFANGKFCAGCGATVTGIDSEIA